MATRPQRRLDMKLTHKLAWVVALSAMTGCTATKSDNGTGATTKTPGDKAQPAGDEMTTVAEDVPVDSTGVNGSVNLTFASALGLSLADAAAPVAAPSMKV